MARSRRNQTRRGSRKGRSNQRGGFLGWLFGSSEEKKNEVSQEMMAPPSPAPEVAAPANAVMGGRRKTRKSAKSHRKAHRKSAKSQRKSAKSHRKH